MISPTNGTGSAVHCHGDIAYHADPFIVVELLLRFMNARIYP